MRHTAHSRERVIERVGAGVKEILRKIEQKNYISLRRLTCSKRASLIEVDGKYFVAIWTSSTNEIITVIDAESYIGRYKNKIHADVLKRASKMMEERKSDD